MLRHPLLEAERSLFLQPVVEALLPRGGQDDSAQPDRTPRPHARPPRPCCPTSRTCSARSPARHGSVELERRRAFEAVTALLRGLAGRSPVLLVVDDLQYAGQSTVELLHFVGRHVADSRLLTLVTVRAENAAAIGAALEPAAATVEVGPLPLAAVQQLAAEAGQSAFAADILQRTGGHTLFVVEVLRALSGGDTGVPESLRSAIQARVRRSGGPLDALLRAAAVIGAAVDPLLLGVMLGLAPAAAVEHCEQALAARLLVVSGRHYEFANDLIREVLYDSTPEPTRLAYHRRAADLLTAQPEALAGHAAASGDWTRAARAWLLAAEQAMGRYAASDAVALATSALVAAERAGLAEVAVRAQIARGRAHEAAGTYPAALRDFTAGAERARAAGDRRQEMFVLRELGGDARRARHAHHVLRGESGQRPADRRVTGRPGKPGRPAQPPCHRRDQPPPARPRTRTRVARGRDRAGGRRSADARGRTGRPEDRVPVPGRYRESRRGDRRTRTVAAQPGRRLRLQWSQFESAYLSFAAADGTRRKRASSSRSRPIVGFPSCAPWYIAHLGLLARLRGHDAEAVSLGRSRRRARRMSTTTTGGSLPRGPCSAPPC